MLKTLILNGSPRKNGNSVELIKKITENLDGEYKIVSTYYADISPCIDCRHCWYNIGCSIDDEMTDIYDYIEKCDNIVIVSPIYFSQPTGKLLDVCSRFQTYFAAEYFQNKKLPVKDKKGAVVLVGGGDGDPIRAYKTLCGILKHIRVVDIFRLVGSFKTNEISAINDKKALEDIADLIDFLNNK